MVLLRSPQDTPRFGGESPLPLERGRDRVRGGVEALRMDLADGGAIFPPHPGAARCYCLPWGEGESSAAAWLTNAPGRAGNSALNRAAHGASGSDARLKQNAGCWFPLPE